MRVLANGALIGETGVDARQRWTLIAGSTLPVGSYDITVSLTQPSGEGSSQIEFPLERFAPDLDMLAVSTPELTGGSFTEDVWQFRRSLYGGGTQHTVIYSPLILVP